MTPPASGGSPAITEEPLSEDMLQNLKACADEAIAVLRLNSDASPADIIAGVDVAVRNFQNEGGEAPSSPFDDAPLHFGSLWGEQLVATLDWEWAEFTFHEHDDSKAIGVVSKDRSQMICPFHFVFGCMAYDAAVTIELAYNFLKDADSPEVQARRMGDPPQPNAYVNYMECIHHLIPPN